MLPPARPRVLLVDAELATAQALGAGLAAHEFDAVASGSAAKALTLLAQAPFAAVVTDLGLPGGEGLSLIAQAHRQAPELPILVLTAPAASDSAIEAIRQGAYHYLVRPFKLEELVLFLRRALDEAQTRREATALRATLGQRYGRKTLLGQSPPMQALLETVDRVAAAEVPLLIGGETGTGKGLLAHVVHMESPRQHGPFVALNCGALPESLLESELFGHEKGAFTGATHSRKGLFAEAEGGTLFLDEIGDLPLALQGKLLHVLEHGEVRPVGANRPRRIDARIIAATHRDLHAAVRAGTFREDLLYRLDVVSVVLPALRHRRQDIPLLLAHFLHEQRGRHPRSMVQRFSPETLARLGRHDWPGNVRELAHLVERLVVLGRSAEVTVAELPPGLLSRQPPQTQAFEGEIVPIRVLQRQYVAWALAQVGGHRGRAAEKLGVDVKTLYNWLAEERAERQRTPPAG